LFHMRGISSFPSSFDLFAFIFPFPLPWNNETWCLLSSHWRWVVGFIPAWLLQRWHQCPTGSKSSVLSHRDLYRCCYHQAHLSSLPLL
jgi:hypothetical protein